MILILLSFLFGVNARHFNPEEYAALIRTRRVNHGFRAGQDQQISSFLSQKKGSSHMFKPGQEDKIKAFWND